jgi:hypothetical protein
MKYLNRQRQQRLNFLKKGIGSKELPPLNFSGLLTSARDNYEAIMVASSVSADPIVDEVSQALDYCNWRIEDTNNTSAYQLQEFSSQPVNYFNEDSENGYYRRKYYFLKYYLQYSDALMSNWSGVSGFSGFDVSGLSGVNAFDLYDKDVQLSAYQVASVKTFLDSLNQKEANDFNLLDKDSEKKVEDVKAIVGNKLPAKDEQTNKYKTEVDTLAEFEKEYEAFIEQLKFEREYKQFIESLKQQKISATSAEL